MGRRRVLSRRGRRVPSGQPVSPVSRLSPACSSHLARVLSSLLRSWRELVDDAIACGSAGKCVAKHVLIQTPVLASSSAPSRFASGSDTAFKQQRLKAWQPILTPRTVLPTLFIIAILFAPIGGLLIWGSNKVRPLAQAELTTA